MQAQKTCEDRWRPHIDTKPFARHRSRIYTALAIAGLTISLTALTQASSIDPTNLVTNGDFTNLAVPGLSAVFGAHSSDAFCITNGCASQQVTGWTTGISPGGVGGFNIVWTPCPAPYTACSDPNVLLNQSPDQGARTANPPGGIDAEHFHLWSRANGGALDNKLAPQCPFSGCGGNYVALDADKEFNGAMFQTIRGLTPGDTYTVKFFWATAQESGKNGETTQMLTVGLCPVGDNNSATGCPSADSKVTTELETPEHGALPWRHGLTDMGKPFTFTATDTSEVLSFLATGTPNFAGAPPIVLLDGISMQQGIQQVPEPNASTLLGLAFAALAGIAYRRPKWLCLQG